MIILVIMDHLLPILTKSVLYVQFWLRLSVPIFLIVMGFNYGHSFQSRGCISLKEIYSNSYFKKKTRRYLVPFLIIFIPLTLIAVLLDNFAFRVFSNRAIFPFWGPGIWYIPVVMSAVLVLPALHLLFTKKPNLTIAACFTNDLIMHAFMYYLLEVTQTGTVAHDLIRFLFQSNIMLYLSAIVLGFWFSIDHNLFSPKHRFIWVAFPFSLLYLILYELVGWRPFFIMGDYNFMMIPYSAVIFLILMKFIPEKSERSWSRVFIRVGRSTFHILLVQAVIFSVLFYFTPGMLAGEMVFTPEIYLILCLIIISISVTIGCAWQWTERRDVLLVHST